MSVHISSACKRIDYRGAKREVLLEFADHANDDGICWPSRARIMYNTGLSESAVKHQTKELREAEVLVVVDHHEGGRGRIPIYKVQPEKGPQKDPFSKWCEDHKKGSKGPPDDPKRGHDVTPEPSIEPSSSSKEDSLRSSSVAGESDESPDDDNQEETKTIVVRGDAEKGMEMGQYFVAYTYDTIREFREANKDPAPEDPTQIKTSARIAKAAVQRTHDPLELELAEEAIRRQVERACGIGGKKAWVAFHTALDSVLADKNKAEESGRGDEDKRKEDYDWIFKTGEVEVEEEKSKEEMLAKLREGYEND